MTGEERTRLLATLERYWRATFKNVPARAVENEAVVEYRRCRFLMQDRLHAIASR